MLESSPVSGQRMVKPVEKLQEFQYLCTFMAKEDSSSSLSYHYHCCFHHRFYQAKFKGECSQIDWLESCELTSSKDKKYHSLDLLPQRKSINIPHPPRRNIWSPQINFCMLKWRSLKVRCTALSSLETKRKKRDGPTARQANSMS